jgi:MFS family permease
MSNSQRTSALAVILPLSVTLAIQALISMAAVAVPVLAPVIAQARGLQAAYVGGFVALVYAGSMISTLLAGALVRRYGAIRVSQACLLFAAAGLLLALIGTMPAMIAAGLVIGFGYGPLTPASSHILVQNTPPQYMSFTFSVKQTGVPVGAAAAGGLLPSVELLAGWQGALAITAAACVIVAVVARVLRADLDTDRDGTTPVGFGSALEPIKLVLEKPALRQMALISLSYAAVQLCLMTFLVTYLNKELGFSLVTAGLLLSVANLAGIGGRIAWGAMADRVAPARIMLAGLGFAMSAGCVFTALLTPETPIAAMLAIVALFGATAIGWNGVYLAEVARRAPAGKAGIATGGTLFFTYTGVLIAPPVFGVLATYSTYAQAYAFLAVIGFTCGFLLMRLSKSSRQTG